MRHALKQRHLSTQRQLVLFDKFANEPIPLLAKRQTPVVDTVDAHVWDLRRKYVQGAESNQNTQLSMMNRCLRKTDGDVELALRLFQIRMRRSMRRRQKKDGEASTH